MSHVTTHVLDAATGTPAVGVPVALLHGTGAPLAIAATDPEGRISDLGPDELEAGAYRLIFDTKAYYGMTGTTTFYPQVTIDFEVVDGVGHYHVPLLLSPFAYSTYRGN